MNSVKGRFSPGTTAAVVAVHVVAVYGVWWCATWGVSTRSFFIALGLYIISSLGITVGYHRYFTHGAFHCRKSVKLVLAIAGALAVEGPARIWCAKHRQHHRYTDAEYDPHSPLAYRHLRYPMNRIAGFLWSHLGWLFWDTKTPAGYDPKLAVHDIAIIAWQERYYWRIVVAGFLVPFMLVGWSGLFLAGFIRVVAHWHVTWMVNSVCHMWGTRPLGPDGEVWKKDDSRNNLLVALLGMGEGWHGNHHIHPNSAQLGYRWYQWDPGKWVIHLLELTKLARDVRRFTKA